VTEHRGHLTFATKKTTPVGHWMGIIAILCRQEKKNEQENARTYALASASIFDAFISCWDEKYRSQTLRPITVIREKIEENWNPLLQTPPFPEYTSGHSVISSAVATVLEHLFGQDVSFHDTTEMEYLGLDRNFSSIQLQPTRRVSVAYTAEFIFAQPLKKAKSKDMLLGKCMANIS